MHPSSTDLRPPSSSDRRISSRRIAGWSGLQVAALLAGTALLTAGLTFWIARTYLFPRDFEPVTLSQSEQVELDGKLRALGITPGPTSPSDTTDARRRNEVNSRADEPPAVSTGPRDGRPTWTRSKPKAGSPDPGEESAESWLRPEPYREDPSKREIGLTERELNALLAHNTDLATRLAIDLSDDLASGRLLVPIDPDFPFFGGRTLRVAAGLELSYANDRPLVILRGVSLMGVPIPNAWLGNLKNVDLVGEFGGGPGFWKSFGDGIEFAEIREGELKIKLRE